MLVKQSVFELRFRTSSESVAFAEYLIEDALYVMDPILTSFPFASPPGKSVRR